MHSKLTLVVVCVIVAIMAIMVYRYSRIPRPILDQTEEFYRKHADHTRAYLARVYPIAAKTLASMDAMDIARFYNKLDFIYNCCYSYTGQLAPGGGWDALPCCSNKSNLLPYAPMGYMYLWATYATQNKHTVYSDGKTFDGAIFPINMIGSQRVDIPWGARPDGGEVDAANRSGPSPYWISLYTLIRNIYYPFGPVYDHTFKKWTYLDGIDPQNRDNMGFTCKTRNWAFGIPAGEYVEVTHSAWEPGMVQSQGMWLNPFFGGGTGLFYQIGHTFIANNKMDGLFKLAQQLAAASSSDLDMPDMREQGGIDFSSMSGSQILKHWYGTDDPYTIVWRYCTSDETWPAMARTSTGGWVVVPKQWIYIDNKGVLSATGLFTPGKIGQNGQPYGPNAAIQFAEVAQWYADKHGVSGKDIIRFAIDGARQARDYLLDRVCTIVAFDEPIFWLANVLGYETVQLPVSANGNGLWSPEIIHTVVPDATWAKHVKGRLYDFVAGDDAKSMFDISKGAPRYTVEALEKWQDMISHMITSRNPFDLSESAACSSMGSMKGKVITYDDKYFTQWPGCSADENSDRCWKSDSNDYGEKTPQCATNGQWGVTVEGAQTFPGRTFWGHYNPKKGCYPFYENIYCNNSLSAEYSNVRIYTGKDLGRTK